MERKKKRKKEKKMREMLLCVFPSLLRHYLMLELLFHLH